VGRTSGSTSGPGGTHVGEVKVKGSAAMVPGIQLGWEGTLALSLDNQDQMALLNRLNKIRIETHAQADRRYIPVQVNSDGEVQSAVMISDLSQGDVRLETLEKRATGAQFTLTTPDVELNIVSEEPDNTQNKDTDNAEEVGAEVVGEMVEVEEDASQLEEVDGVLGGWCRRQGNTEY